MEAMDHANVAMLCEGLKALARRFDGRQERYQGSPSKE